VNKYYIPQIKKEMVNTRVERKFISCNCCKQKSTIDFVVDVFYNPNHILIVEYTAENGEIDNKISIYGCPCCKAKLTGKVKTLKTIKYDANHKCDDKCKNAVSEECTCSCNGLNHGINNKIFK
jgi:hypothetical protein